MTPAHMTHTEGLAYRWLIERQGYSPADIVFQFRTSPDFRTADGRGWEVKRLLGNSATFYVGQLAIFREVSPTVLFWRDDSIPSSLVDFRQLSVPGVWNGLRLHVRYQPLKGLIRSLHTPAELDAAIAEWLGHRALIDPKYRRPLPSEMVA